MTIPPPSCFLPASDVSSMRWRHRWRSLLGQSTFPHNRPHRAQPGKAERPDTCGGCLANEPLWGVLKCCWPTLIGLEPITTPAGAVFPVKLECFVSRHTRQHIGLPFGDQQQTKRAGTPAYPVERTARDEPSRACPDLLAAYATSLQTVPF